MALDSARSPRKGLTARAGGTVQGSHESEPVMDDLAAVFGPPPSGLPSGEGHGPTVEQSPPSPADVLRKLRADFPDWAFMRDPAGWWHALHHREVISRADPAAIRVQVEARTNGRRPP